MANDIRWIQRFSNYSNALEQLNSAVEIFNSRELFDLEKQGLIQSFEYTHDLSWNVLKDFLEFRGNSEIYGSRDATREAFKYGLIENGEIWMSMIKSRNRTTHTYNRETAEEIIQLIVNSYTAEYNNIYKKMIKLKEQDLNDN